ncbi:MAG: 30S ribosome-binding factor RbfA [Christensenellaceae bacterium]|jgi:ribosome-binding factor A|nr:30S ribosome-binding factor RbfA [Christensenellaceae bacterium]
MKERVDAEIQKAISEMILKKEIHDPRITAAFVTVTGVDCAKDGNAARVFISVLTGDKKGVLEGLKSASGYIKAALFKKLRLRRAPDLLFRLDETEEKAVEIENLLKDIDKGTTDGTE